MASSALSESVPLENPNDRMGRAHPRPFGNRSALRRRQPLMGRRRLTNRTTNNPKAIEEGA